MQAAELELREATPGDAAELLAVIQAAFSARRPVDPPADALLDDASDIADAIERGSGVVVLDAGKIIAGLVIDLSGEVATLRRVSVLPSEGGRGVAQILVEGALTLCADLGASTAELVARVEFPELVKWWQARGFEVTGSSGHVVSMSIALPILIDVPTPAAMQKLGERIAAVLKPGDVIIATGDLGAGKTTLAQGIGAGLQVEGPIISPTFVISRQHRSLVGGPDLVHVDAYRLGDSAELADIDLDTSLPESITLVEWGAGVAEWLGPDRLEIFIERDVVADRRTVFLSGVGSRWAGALEQFREQ